MKGSKLSRVEALEAKRRKWEAEHLPASDIPGFLFAVLNVVFDEAGPDVGARVAGRIVGEKARRVAALAGGGA